MKPLNVPIISIEYSIKDAITTCAIRWQNPLNENIRKSFGVSKCNPKDTFDETLGKRLAESRAKRSIWYTYIQLIDEFNKAAFTKHIRFIQRELSHERKLLSAND